MRGLGQKTKASILNAPNADIAMGLIRKLIRERVGDEYENEVQITATHGKYTIAFPHERGFTIKRSGLSRADLLEFVAGLQRD